MASYWIFRQNIVKYCKITGINKFTFHMFMTNFALRYLLKLYMYVNNKRLPMLCQSYFMLTFGKFTRKAKNDNLYESIT